LYRHLKQRIETLASLCKITSRKYSPSISNRELKHYTNRRTP